MSSDPYAFSGARGREVLSQPAPAGAAGCWPPAGGRPATSAVGVRQCNGFVILITDIRMVVLVYVFALNGH